MVLWLAIVVLVLSVDAIQGNPVGALVKTSSFRKCGRVHITVSSFKEAYLELNWITDCDHPLDTPPSVIALFDKDPASNEDLQPLESIYAANHPSGFYRTVITFGDPHLPGNWEYSEDLTKADPGKHCFPYYIVSITEDGDILDKQCLGIQPTWMNDNRESLVNQRIDEMLIPGTHNSGSYDPSRLAALIQNYVLNQDKLIWTQLVFGIRYLDLRIGYYKNEGFFINHDLIRVTPFGPVLKQIRKFLELTNEVVIIDFHRFPYPTEFTADIHEMLLDLVYEELGEFTFSRMDYAGRGPIYNELWDQQKQLIIGYADNESCKQHLWLWFPIAQHWADTVSTETLKAYMEDKINNYSLGNNPFWALMAELTPQAMDILLLTNNLRKLADDVNRELTKWFRDEWGMLKINIVATDFFLGNDLINVAIDEIRSG